MEFEASVDEVLRAAVDLIDITSQETELLRVMRPADIQDVMEAKQRIAQYYGTLLKRLERRKEVFRALPERRKDEVREVSDWVMLISIENATLLRAAADANERLLLAIKEAAEEHYGGNPTVYGRSGRMDQTAMRDPTVRVTLGIKETA